MRVCRYLKKCREADRSGTKTRVGDLPPQLLHPNKPFLQSKATTRTSEVEIYVGPAGAELHNLEIEGKSEEVGIIQHSPKNLFFGVGCL